MFDEDIKIANPDGRIKEKDEEETPDVSKEYDRESANGNIEKARSLGVLLAKEAVNKSIEGYSGGYFPHVLPDGSARQLD